MTEQENNKNAKDSSHTSVLMGLSAISTLALITTHYLKYSNDLAWAKFFNQSWNPTIADPTFAITNITIGVILLLSVAAIVLSSDTFSSTPERQNIYEDLVPTNDELNELGCPDAYARTENEKDALGDHTLEQAIDLLWGCPK